MQPNNSNRQEKPNDAVTNEFSLDNIPEIPLTGHQWMQMGTELRCTSCPFVHGTYIASDFQLYGMDEEGKPLIRKIEVH